uniref:Uncharacterized protein n=1 Tax=Arundo donax TaxID=35708 RepID=A0A0A9E5G5_ARUDO
MCRSQVFLLSLALILLLI